MFTDFCKAKIIVFRGATLNLQMLWCQPALGKGAVSGSLLNLRPCIIGNFPDNDKDGIRPP